MAQGLYPHTMCVNVSDVATDPIACQSEQKFDQHLLSFNLGWSMAGGLAFSFFLEMDVLYVPEYA